MNAHSAHAFASPVVDHDLKGVSKRTPGIASIAVLLAVTVLATTIIQSYEAAQPQPDIVTFAFRV